MSASNELGNRWIIAHFKLVSTFGAYKLRCGLSDVCLCFRFVDKTCLRYFALERRFFLFFWVAAQFRVTLEFLWVAKGWVFLSISTQTNCKCILFFSCFVFIFYKIIFFYYFEILDWNILLFSPVLNNETLPAEFIFKNNDFSQINIISHQFYR